MQSLDRKLKAKGNKLIESNPARNLVRRFDQKLMTKKKTEEEEIDPLTKEELKYLLGTVRDQFPEHYTLFLLLARTGCRVGEALGLKWEDIDLMGWLIEIKRTDTKGKTTPTKGSYTRRIDMSIQLRYALQRHPITGKLVFINRNGNPIDVDNWRRRVFNKAPEKAKLRKIRIQHLRHSYATIRISAGHNIADV